MRGGPNYSRADMPRARICALLATAADQGLSRAGICAALHDLKPTTVSMTLNQLLKGGHVAKSAHQGGVWTIGAKPLDVQPSAGPDLAMLVTIGELADALILASESGIDSIALAEELGTTLISIECALAAGVDAHHFVTCDVFRNGQAGVMYRRSPGGTVRFDWRAEQKQTWQKALLKMAQPRPVVARAVTPPPPATLQQVCSKDEADETAAAAPSIDAALAAGVGGIVERFVSERPLWPMPPGQAAAEEEAPLSLDRLVVKAMESSPLEREAEPGSDFLCALFSNGALQMNVRGVRVTLELAHTERLIAYLDHIDVLDLLAAAKEARA